MKIMSQCKMALKIGLIYFMQNKNNYFRGEILWELVSTLKKQNKKKTVSHIFLAILTVYITTFSHN